MSEREDYFEYVINVLGVKSVYIENNQSVEHTPLLICVQDYQTYNAQEKDLLEKMVTALKIDLIQIKISDTKNSASIQFDFKLSLLESPIHTQNINEVVTFSPRALLKNNNLKKQAWADLQKVIQFFLTK